VVLWKRVSVSGLDSQARLQDRWLARRQGFGVDPLDKHGDCISTKMYNGVLADHKCRLTSSKLVVFNEQGVTMLEDGLYVMESQFRDSVFVKIIASFVKVSMQGWEYARQNPYGVTNIVLANGTNGAEREASAAHSERN
jgi:NitT/TauT family transport system substrate-binding protein